MTHNINIETAKITDLEDILKLNLSLFKYERQFDISYNLEWTYSEIGKNTYIKRIEEDWGIVLVAKYKDVIVGYICGMCDFYPFRSVNKIAEIENMFVEEEFQNKGIGSKLVYDFIKIAKNKGSKRIKVGTLFNNQKAINFYKQLGLFETELYLEKEIN